MSNQRTKNTIPEDIKYNCKNKILKTLHYKRISLIENHKKFT